MTIDERIEKLAERHEALAQIVELLAAQVQGVSKTVDVLAQGIHDLLGVVRSHEGRIAGLESRLT